jgi:lysophospholipase L1-like esterase
MKRLFATFVVLAVSAACGNDQPVAPGFAPPPGAPSLTCPGDRTEAGVTGSSRVLTYSEPSPSGGHPPVTSSCTPASGSTFPLGTTLVTCLARDSLNQQRTCSFTVTLTPLKLTAMTFVTFGDSLTEGENGEDGDGPCPASARIQCIDVPNAYPAVLARLLRDAFPTQSVSVINEGISGRTALADVARLPAVLDEHEPDALLILHGFNDLRGGGPDAVTDVVAAIRDQIRIARDEGVPHVYVSTLLPPGAGFRMIEPEIIEEVNAGLRQMVPAEGARLVETYPRFVGREATLIAPDGLHLTAAGNQVLAESFFDAIASTLTMTRRR